MKKIILIDNNLGNGETFFNYDKFVNLLKTIPVNYNLKIKIDHNFHLNCWNIIFSNKNKSFCFNIFMDVQKQNHFFNNLDIDFDDYFNIFSFINLKEVFDYIDKEVEKLNLIPKKIILLEKKIYIPIHI